MSIILSWELEIMIINIKNPIYKIKASIVLAIWTSLKIVMKTLLITSQIPIKYNLKGKFQ